MLFHQREGKSSSSETKPQKINKRVMTSQLLNIKKSKIKATNISETTTLTEGPLFVSNDANATGSLGRIECCVVMGSVQSGTETVSLKQSYIYLASILPHSVLCK